ncbi:MAG: FAD-dependent thymidylate synthase [Patescibacteria group bacterium]
MSGERRREYPSAYDYLQECLLLEEVFAQAPIVKLELVSRSPFSDQPVGARDVAIATAYQCNSAGTPELKKRDDEKAQKVASSTLQAGHHTTRQHVHFTWRFIGVSRSVTHDVFHSYPFYNSEQQSQRYVEAQRGNYLAPANLSERQKLVFHEAADFANHAYFHLLEELAPEVEKRVKDMYPTSGWRVPETAERLGAKGRKICQEIARYVLPIGQKTVYFHTLSELQLLRLFRASTLPRFSSEARYVIARMVKSVADYDAGILKEIDVPWPQAAVLSGTDNIMQRKKEFDEFLGDKSSLLIGYPPNAGEILTFAVRNTWGLPESCLSVSEALDSVANPAKNSLLADVYDVGMLDNLTVTLRQVSLTYLTKLSHTADSQRQRHRKTFGSTPSIEEIYDGSPDFLVPLVIRENPHLFRTYREIMERIYQNVERALGEGVPREWALLLLPNAQTVRVVESGDLFDWHHRWRQRLCFLAQEEIFFISVDQIEELRRVLPQAEKMLLAPCGLRKAAKVKPRCPEGDRWCGQAVYNWEIQRYKESRLI